MEDKIGSSGAVEMLVGAGTHPGMLKVQIMPSAVSTIQGVMKL